LPCLEELDMEDGRMAEDGLGKFGSLVVVAVVMVAVVMVYEDKGSPPLFMVVPNASLFMLVLVSDIFFSRSAI